MFFLYLNGEEDPSLKRYGVLMAPFLNLQSSMETIYKKLFFCRTAFVRKSGQWKSQILMKVKIYCLLTLLPIVSGNSDGLKA